MPIYTNDHCDDGLFPVDPSLRSSIGIGPKVTKAIDSATKDWLDNHPQATTTVKDNSLTNVKFMDGSVNSRVIENESITTNDIADLAVTTPKIADDAVTAAKIAQSAADGLRTMSTMQPGVAKVGAGLAINNGAIELDGGSIAPAVTAWLDAHPEATTTVQDDSITLRKLGGGVGKVFSFDDYTLVEGKYVNLPAGNIISSSAYSYIMIPVRSGYTYSYTPGRAENSAGFAFYLNETPSSVSFISGGVATESEQVVTAPENAKYACFTFRPSVKSPDDVAKVLGTLQALQDDIFDIENPVIGPQNLKENILLSELADGIEIINNKRIQNYDTTTRELQFIDTDTCYLIKVDLTKVKSGKLLCDSQYTQETAQTFRGVTLAAGSSGDRWLWFSNWSTLVTDGSWIVVDDDGSWVLDIANAIDEKVSPTYGAPTALYVGYEYRKDHLIYYDGLALLPSWLQPMGADDIEAVINETISLPELVLPSNCVAVVGHEWNMYVDNVVQRLTDSYYVSVSAPTITESNMWLLSDTLRILPTANDVGNHNVNVSLIRRKDSVLVGSASFVLHVIPDATITNKSVLFIGDSLTDAGVYPAEIQYNLSNGGITSIGTRSDTVTIGGERLTVSHEGRGGWASYDYTRTRGTYRTDADNAFWDGSAFNFSWYMSQQGYSNVDAVCIGLGTNGWGLLEDTCTALDVMISSIRDYSQTVPILIALTAPPAKQDGCGKSNHLQSSDGMKYREMELVKEYIRRYQDTDDANLDVIELYFHLDTAHDFGTVTEAASARNPVQVSRQNNNVHPTTYGYLHFADAYYNRLLYHLA